MKGTQKVAALLLVCHAFFLCSACRTTTFNPPGFRSFFSEIKAIYPNLKGIGMSSHNGGTLVIEVTLKGENSYDDVQGLTNEVKSFFEQKEIIDWFDAQDKLKTPGMVIIIDNIASYHKSPMADKYSFDWNEHVY